MQRGVDGGGQRASVGGPRLVVAEIRLKAPGYRLFGQEVVDHQYVRLLDHLSAPGALGSEQQVCRNRTVGGELGDDQRLQPVESGELLVDPGVGVVAVNQGVGEFRPGQALVDTGVRVGRLHGLGGSTQVPPSHDVGVRVVVHRLVVFVGADDSEDVCSCRRRRLGSSKPSSERSPPGCRDRVRGRTPHRRTSPRSSTPPTPRRRRCAPRAGRCEWERPAPTGRGRSSASHRGRYGRTPTGSGLRRVRSTVPPRGPRATVAGGTRAWPGLPPGAWRPGTAGRMCPRPRTRDRRTPYRKGLEPPPVPRHCLRPMPSGGTARSGRSTAVRRPLR